MVSEVVRSSRNWENLTAIQTHQMIKSDTLSWCQRVVRIQITFKTNQTPATKEFEQGKLECEEDHLAAIELYCTTG